MGEVIAIQGNQQLFFFFTVITDPQRQPAWRKVKYRISMLALLHTALNHRNYQKMV